MNVLNGKRILKRLKSNPLLLFVVIFQLLTIIANFRAFDLNTQIGYLDHQIFWEGMKRLTYGEVIYKDFYWEYGLLYLLYGLPFFILFGQGLKAYMIIRFFLFPITNAVLLFIIGKQFLEKKWLLAFIFLSTLYGALNFAGFRHLLPTTGLAFFIAGLSSTNKKKVYAGSFLLGLSLISSVEYGVISLLVLSFYLIAALLTGKIEFKIKRLIKFLLPVFAIGTVYLFYLIYHQALSNMITYYLESAESFYTLSPCRQIFPRLKEIKDTSLVAFLVRAKLYLVPILLSAALFYTILNKKRVSYHLEISSFLLFSLVAYTRTVVTPCEIYLQYGMVTFFLPLIILVSKENLTKNVRNILLAALFFLALVVFPNALGLVSRNFIPQNKANYSYSRYLKVWLEKDLAQEFDEVFFYLQENTNRDDTIFVYPHGPYHLILNRRSPISTSSTLYYQMSPSVLPRVLKDFENNPPDYIVLNGVNASDYISNLLALPYNVVSQGDTVLFTGNVTPVEKRISTNYKLIKKFGRVWVLQRKGIPAEYEAPFISAGVPEYSIETQNLKRTEVTKRFKVINKPPTVTYLVRTDDISGSGLIKIPIKIPLGKLKMFSKYFVQIFVSEDNKNYYGIKSGQLVSGDWQEYWIKFSRNPESLGGEYFIIKMILSSDVGFLPFLEHPKYLEIEDPEIFLRNPNLSLDDYLLELKGFDEYLNIVSN